jgi:Cu/Ag efflux pump CusA
VILAGLLPILPDHGTRSEIMQRIAAPVGGMIAAPLRSTLMIRVVSCVLRSPRAHRQQMVATA